MKNKEKFLNFINNSTDTELIWDIFIFFNYNNPDDWEKLILKQKEVVGVCFFYKTFFSDGYARIFEDYYDILDEIISGLSNIGCEIFANRIVQIRSDIIKCCCADDDYIYNYLEKNDDLRKESLEDAKYTNSIPNNLRAYLLNNLDII